MTPSREYDAASSPAVEPALLPAVSQTRTIRVVLVEDDKLYRETLTYELSRQGFVVRGFSDGPSLLDSLNAAVDADVVILDWRLPKMSGIDLLLQLRRHGVNLPVVFLTRCGQGANESLAMDVGAIDWSDRSRGAEIFVKRLKRVVEAARPEVAVPREEHVVCGKLTLNRQVGRAYWSGKDVGLSFGEYNIVDLLVVNVGSYVTYRAVYDLLHYEGFVAGTGELGYRANVRSVIKRIRKKFRECDPAFLEIENYTGFGYRWKKPVSLCNEVIAEKHLKQK
jgi:two-component system, OmpR family, response regulator ChvI